MKTLVVGNSADVLPIIGHIQAQGQLVTLFATEGVLPYERRLLPDMLAGSVSEESLFTTSKALLAKHQPTLVTQEALNRISVKRRYLTTAKKAQIDYDRLILVDTGELILPAVKGLQRTGVFDCWRLTSIKAMQKYLPFMDSVIVPATRIQGLNIACALSQFKKEVTVVSSGLGLLPEIFDEETGLLLKQILEGKGIRVINENAVEEILGEAEVKAVKLRSGKVLACEAVIFDEAKADIRMLSEPTLTHEDKICIEDCFKPPVMPLMPASFGFHVLDGFYAGWTRLPEGGREYLKFDGPQNTYKKIYAHGDHLAGMVTFNASPDNERLLEILQRQDNITGKEEEIL
ncbi:MAG: FAD-dependent oxidoreductase [Candidatus Omnitrophica bacterium]|nr:FAD-dependent oxidoreductase [Candidatus Omnitrophota bacterium]MDE2222574.1 FAD-dependent oxidoreductase [Candidatus Omnitrophota bacterium]